RRRPADVRAGAAGHRAAADDGGPVREVDTDRPGRPDPDGGGTPTREGRRPRRRRRRRRRRARGPRAVTRALATAWWYLRAIMGETAYDQYLEHRERTHPGQPVL